MSNCLNKNEIHESRYLPISLLFYSQYEVCRRLSINETNLTFLIYAISNKSLHFLFLRYRSLFNSPILLRFCYIRVFPHSFPFALNTLLFLIKGIPFSTFRIPLTCHHLRKRWPLYPMCSFSFCKPSFFRSLLVSFILNHNVYCLALFCFLVCICSCDFKFPPEKWPCTSRSTLVFMANSIELICL